MCILVINKKLMNFGFANDIFKRCARPMTLDKQFKSTLFPKPFAIVWTVGHTNMNLVYTFTKKYNFLTL